MDDVLVLAPTRWKLRRAVRVVNQVLGGLRLEKHPDKTFIGKIERGFDFLGFHFSRGGLRIAKATVQRFVEHAARLYEQDREEPSMPSPLGRYVRRWVGWAKCGWPPSDPIRTKRSSWTEGRERDPLSQNGIRSHAHDPGIDATNKLPVAGRARVCVCVDA
jgi:hypothetical protein